MAIEMLIDLKRILAKLSAKQAEVIRLRFFGNQTLYDVGLALGVNTERARQIEAKALRLIRQELQRHRIRSMADVL